MGKFNRDLLITPVAAGEVLKELIPEETDPEVLKEIIEFASILAPQWDNVWMLAETRLEIIEKGSGEAGG